MGVPAALSEDSKQKVSSEDAWNHLFPNLDGRQPWGIRLRFRPSFAHERQITVISKPPNLELRYWSVGIRPTDVFRGRTFVLLRDLPTLTKLKECTVTVPNESLTRLIGQFPSVLNQTIDSSAHLKWSERSESAVVLDGTTYTVNFDTSPIRLEFTVQDDELSDTQVNGATAIAKWMNQVRLLAEENLRQAACK